MCIFVQLRIRVRACPRPKADSWIGKAGADVFSVDGKFGGELKIYIFQIRRACKWTSLSPTPLFRKKR